MRRELADASEPVWQLFARALAQLSAGGNGAESTGGVSVPNAPLAALTRAVQQAVRGEVVTLDAAAVTFPVRPVLDALRRHFVDEVAEAGGLVDAADMARMLRAIDVVQHAADSDVAQRFVDQLNGRSATQLVAEVAHDMRSPLGAILFLAEHLRHGANGTLHPVQIRQLGLIYSAALGLSGMTNDVLDMVRGGDRLVDHEPIPFSLADVIGPVYDIVRPMAEEKGLELVYSLPDADSRRGHPTALGRILLNLVTNAIKFTPAGCVSLEVKALDRSRLEFSVQDTGRGIPADVLATIYDAFRRRPGGGEGHVFSSAGLGLAICHKLITALGGELAIQTELGRGTRFTFVLDLPVAPRM